MLKNSAALAAMCAAAAFCLAVSLPDAAAARNMVMVSSGRDSFALIDTDSIVKTTPSTARVWMTEVKVVDNTAFAYALILNDINCSSREVTFKQAAVYDPNGNFVKLQKEPDSWHVPVPGTVDEVMVNYTCGGPKRSQRDFGSKDMPGIISEIEAMLRAHKK